MGDADPARAGKISVDDRDITQDRCDRQLERVLKRLDAKFPGWRTTTDAKPHEYEAYIRDVLESDLLICHECLEVGDLDGKRCDNCTVFFCIDCCTQNADGRWPDADDLDSDDEDVTCSDCRKADKEEEERRREASPQRVDRSDTEDRRSSRVKRRD